MWFRCHHDNTRESGLQENVLQEGEEEKMAEIVDGKMRLEAVLGEGEVWLQEASIADEYVKRQTRGYEKLWK